MANATAHGNGIVRHDDLLIPVGSETVAASRYEPEDVDGPLPTVLMSAPYRKDDYITFGNHDDVLRYVAECGYEVVVSDLLGTGASSGVMDEPYGPTDAEEVLAIIDWIVAKEWSNGRIGMYGHSWGGQTQLRAAAAGHDALQAVVPVQPAIDHYEDLYYRGGVYSPRSFPTWFHTLQAMPPSRRDADGRWAAVWKRRLDALRDGTPYLFQLLDNDVKTEYWRSKAVPTDDIDVPMLIVAGYRDTHPECDIECFRRATGPKRLLLGPWRHGLPHRGREAAIDFRRQVVEWFDHFLKDEETAALDRPSIVYWTERDGGGDPGVGRWRATDAWPDATASTSGAVAFAMAADGLVPIEDFASGTVEREYEHDHTVGMDSLDYMVDEPTDTNADDARSVTFETAPLADPIELTGSGTATVRIRSTTPDPILGVRVVDVAPDGGARLVTYGYLHPSHRESHETPTALTPGEEYEIAVPFRAKSHVFERGHTIRMSIGAAHFPLTFPASPHGSLTLLSSPDTPSRLVLPGRRHHGEVSFDDAIEMALPDDIAPIGTEHVTDSASAWETSRRYPEDEATFERENTKAIELPHGATMRTRRAMEARTRADAPTSAVVRHDTEVVLEYDHETVRAASAARIAHDTAQLTTEVTVDDRIVFEKSWSR